MNPETAGEGAPDAAEVPIYTTPFRSGTGPVTASERFLSLDALRGVAVVGILVMNVYAFAMPFPKAYSNPLAMGGTDAVNLGIWFFTHFLFDQKFISIFAMLFGAGIVLMAERAEARQARFAATYYRRMACLLLIGLLHAYLLWFGDILFSYAVVGMLVYPLRRLKPARLVLLALLLMPITPLLSYGISFYTENVIAEAAALEASATAGATLGAEEQQELEEWESLRPLMAPTREDLEQDVDVHRGGYLEIIANRAPFLIGFQVVGLLVFGLWRIGSLMLLGMALMKSGILSGQRSAGFYGGMMFAGYGLGLPLTVFSGLDLYAQQFDPIYAARYGGIANYFGSVMVACGHMGLVILVVKLGFLQRLMRRFAAVGQMALTNYLLHSVILTTVFYGYGFGLYGHLDRSGQMGLVVAVAALQLALSPWWLGRYRFGPVEWFWRSATYGALQPMRQAGSR